MWGSLAPPTLATPPQARRGCTRAGLSAWPHGAGLPGSAGQQCSAPWPSSRASALPLPLRPSSSRCSLLRQPRLGRRPGGRRRGRLQQRARQHRRTGRRRQARCTVIGYAVCGAGAAAAVWLACLRARSDKARLPLPSPAVPRRPTVPAGARLGRTAPTSTTRAFEWNACGTSQHRCILPCSLRCNCCHRG